MAELETHEWESREWLGRHLERERRQADRLGDIREAMFGMQDGIVSTLAVVSTVSSATGERYAVLVAGLASALAGVFSMAAGEYMSSKSQREIYLAQIDGEREEVERRPQESRAEVAYLLEEEGLDRDAAQHIATELARNPNVLLRTMVEKELGVVVDEGRGALAGAVTMGLAFGIASLVPILPYAFVPVASGVLPSIVASGVVLFVIGFLKSRWTRRNPLVSGLEIVALAAFAGIAGLLFGDLLPDVLGAPKATP